MVAVRQLYGSLADCQGSDAMVDAPSRGTSMLVDTRGAGDNLTVFISYSRADIAGADLIDATLRIGGFDTRLDRHSIEAGEDWRRRLGTLIVEADTIVFVLSATSAASPVCAWEVDEAVRLGKRILPVVFGPVEGIAPPPGLANLNYTYLYSEPKRPGSGLGPGLLELVQALRTDVGWLRESTRYLQRAREWDEGGRNVNRLLSGTDIGLARDWLQRQPKTAPALVPLQLDFLRMSEEEEARRLSTEEQRLRQMADAQSAREAALAEKEVAQKREIQASRLAARRARMAVAGAFAFATTATAAGIFVYVTQQQNIARLERQADSDRAAELLVRGCRTSRRTSCYPSWAVPRSESGTTSSREPSATAM